MEKRSAESMCLRSPQSNNVSIRIEEACLLCYSTSGIILLSPEIHVNPPDVLEISQALEQRGDRCLLVMYLLVRVFGQMQGTSLLVFLFEINCPDHFGIRWRLHFRNKQMSTKFILHRWSLHYSHLSMPKLFDTKSCLEVICQSFDLSKLVHTPKYIIRF